MKISVIIPTYNEEKFLPLILSDLKKQTFKDFEVIVSDANSKDKTRQIAEKFKVTVVDGGFPSVGRNNGAKFSKGEVLFFLDSDVRLKKDFLEKAYNEFQKRYLDFATCEVVPISKKPFDKFIHNVVNTATKIQQFTKSPISPGCCIIISKRLFDRIGGFDETLKLSEDHELGKRAANFRHLRVLHSTKIYLSVRRLDKEGRMTLMWKYAVAIIYRTFNGEIRKDLIDYEFGNFDNDSKKKESFDKEVIHLEKLLKPINLEYKKFIKKQNKSESHFLKNKQMLKIRLKFSRFKDKFWNFLTNKK